MNWPKSLYGKIGKDYVAWDEKQYFEEIMLHGMILGYAKIDFEQLLVYITEFSASNNELVSV